MTTLKVRELKWKKKLKVRKSILHFYQKIKEKIKEEEDSTWSSAPLILSLLRQNHLLRAAMFDVPKKSAILAYKISNLMLLTSCVGKKKPNHM